MGRKQRLTGARKNALLDILPDEVFEQKGLAYTGFPANQHRTSRALRGATQIMPQGFE
jgi:hypothetical protein